MPATMTEPQRELAAKYVPLAKHWAHKQAKRFPHLNDDFYSDAYLALCDAARRFNPESGVKFSTFALRRIRGSATDLIRTEYRKKRLCEASISAVDPEIDRPPQFATPDRSVEDVMSDADEVRHLMACLPESHREVIESLYLEGMSHAEAMGAVGKAASRVSILRSEAMGRLRDCAAKGWDTPRA